MRKIFYKKCLPVAVTMIMVMVSGISAWAVDIDYANSGKTYDIAYENSEKNAYPVYADSAQTENITVTVNGQLVDFDQQPVIENDRTLVPMRAIFEALGAEVVWDNNSRTVKAEWQEDSLSMQIGSDKISMGDGRTVTIAVPAKIENGRTLVPVRAIAESMGADVEWNNDMRQVIIEKGWTTHFVDNVEELVHAIGSDTKIVLAPGTYNLTEYIRQQGYSGTPADSDFYDVFSTDNPNVNISEVFDGYELQINGVENFKIDVDASVSAFGDNVNPATILTEPRYADVLSFVQCDGIGLSGLTVGHMETGHCEGDVLSFDNSSDISLDGVDLYGCGAYAIAAISSRNLTASNSIIRDCSYGIMLLNNCNNFAFDNTGFTNCQQYALLELNDSTASFDQCWFYGNQGEFISCDEASKLSFANCTFDDAELASLKTNSFYGKNISLS